MSKIGKVPVSVPKGVTVAVKDGVVTTKGPKGELKLVVAEGVAVAVEGESIQVSRTAENRLAKAMHGTVRALVKNMVEGVTKGYERKLEVVGVGYRATLQGRKLVMNVGFANSLEVEAPAGIDIKVPDQTHVIVTGIDKQLVGETAAKIRALRKPEPYKGKGVRYEGEQVRRKAGA
jgi:large subunit ribosomal protein L6